MLAGVYTTNIDLQQHKVTVTGNVKPEALIKKLIKTGKHAELWPEPKPTGNNNNSNGGGGGGGGKKNKNKNKNKSNQPKPGNDPSLDTQEPKEPETDRPEENSPAAVKDSADVEPPKNPGKEPPKVAADSNPAPPEKKKKGKKGNNNGNAEAAAPQEDPHQKPTAAAAAPRQQGYYNLPMYPSPPGGVAPQYVVSYSTMQPVAAGSYYIPTVAAVTAGSYDFFSEENANACVVM